MSTQIRSIQQIIDSLGPLKLRSSDAYLTALAWDRHVRNHNPHPLPGEFHCFVQFQHAGNNLLRVHQTICSYWGERYIRRHESMFTLAARDLISVDICRHDLPQSEHARSFGSLGETIATLDMHFAQLVTVNRYMCVPFYHDEVESEIDTRLFTIPLPNGASNLVPPLLQEWQSVTEAPTDSSDQFPFLQDPGSAR